MADFENNCCGNEKNHTIYRDALGNEYLQCSICGKILKPLKNVNSN